MRIDRSFKGRFIGLDEDYRSPTRKGNNSSEKLLLCILSHHKTTLQTIDCLDLQMNPQCLICLNFFLVGFLLQSNPSLNIFQPLAQDYTFFIIKLPHAFVISARQILLGDISVGSPLLLLHLNSSSETNTVISDEKGLLKLKGHDSYSDYFCQTHDNLYELK